MSVGVRVFVGVRVLVDVTVGVIVVVSVTVGVVVCVIVTVGVIGEDASGVDVTLCVGVGVTEHPMKSIISPVEDICTAYVPEIQDINIHSSLPL